MAKAGKDAIAAVIYIIFCAYLFQPYFVTFDTAHYLIPVNCCVGAFGCYLLSKRWVAGFGGRFFAGVIYGFGPFMLFLCGSKFHEIAGSMAAIVPWLFWPGAFGPKGKWQWIRVPLAILPFVVLAGLFRLAGQFGLYPIPTQIRIRMYDLSSILAPAAMVTRVDVLVGFYHVAIGALIIGLAMLAVSRRYSVMFIFALGVVLLVFDTFSGVARIIWLTVPVLCCAVLIGEGIEGIIHCGYSDRKWILASSIVLLACAIVALLFGTKATHVFAGLGSRYTRLFIEAAQMYVAGAIATGVVFFLARGKSRLAWLRVAIVCSAIAVDVFLGAGHVVDSVMQDIASEKTFSKGLAFNGAERETAVTAHKVDDFIELLVDKTSVVRDQGYCDYRAGPGVVVVHFGNRDVEPVFESFNNTLYNSSLIFK